MLSGYAQTSTKDQTAELEAQFAEMGRVSVERLFTEQVSAVAERKVTLRILNLNLDTPRRQAS